MDALALILIRLDITPAQMDEISRASFVKAAASIARKKHSDRPHIARVAALTGLPRTEVRRIINSNYTDGAGGVDRLPRALRVVAAWKASPSYTRKGLPMTLKMSGAPPTFQSLCKEFSGDIPHKAIATELLQRGLVQVRTRGEGSSIRLIRSTAVKDAQLSDTLAFIAGFVHSLSTQDRVLLRKYQTVVSPQNLSASYFQNAVVARVASFVDGLPIEKRPRRGRMSRADALDVFAVVSKSQNK
jgi:Family of unknown function (DUF6502)